VSIQARVPLALSALLAGLAGLGLEVLLVSLCGLSLGYGRSGAIGIALFIAAWALGARWAGTWRGSAARALVLAGVLVLAAALVFPPALLWAGAAAPGGLAAGALSVAALAAVGLPQGAVLPLLARRWPAAGRGGLGALLGLNLAGAALGAQLVGHTLPASLGRPAAAVAGGACALVAGLVGALASRGAVPSAGERPVEGAAPQRALELPLSGWLVAYLTGWAASCEWIGLRLGVLWLGGMQEALTAILTASLAALALGAWLLPLLVGRGPRSVTALLALCALASVLGANAGRCLDPDWPDVALAAALVGPMLVPFGAVVPLLQRETRGRSAEVLGRLLGWEAVGALVGVPLTHWVLVPRFGLAGTLAAWTLGSAACAAPLLPRLRLQAAGAIAVALVMGALAGGRLTREPALASPPLANPALEVLAFDEDENFAVAVVADGILGERTLLTDGFRAAGTGRDYEYMRVLGHLPLLLHPAPRRVAVLALGTGTSAGAVSLHPQVERIDVLELSRAVCEEARWFEQVNHGVLDDPRVRLRLGDGRRTLAGEPGTYDVITMEPLLPDSPFGVYLYTREFYAVARRALAAGGLLCQWVPPHALEPRVFDAVIDAFARSFEWSAVFQSGTQAILVGARAQPDLAAARFAAEGELAAASAELGLESPAGLVARYVCDGRAWPTSPRALTDADPWIVYLPRRSGAALLLDLPANLGRLRAVDGEPPAAWTVGLDPAQLARVGGLRALRRAREAQAAREAALRGAAPPGESGLDLERELARALELAGADPEVRDFEAELEFLGALREGVGWLANAAPQAGQLALERLLTAAELRPERADVHLYVAAALDRLGEAAAARAALEQARRRCATVRETPAGRRVEGLGFPRDASLRSLFHATSPRTRLPWRAP